MDSVLKTGNQSGAKITPQDVQRIAAIQNAIQDISQDHRAAMTAVSALQPTGLYIHIPFCERKCSYCDFNTYAGLQSLYGPMVDALCQEMKRWQDALQDRTITTVFIGGGTPTVLDAAQFEQLMECMRQTFHLAEGCEITCEANPGAVDRARFALLHALGVNRLSLGVQSLQPEELQFLERIHGVQDVYRAYDAARSAGFDNINLDFIFGLPNQSLAAWQDTMEKALALEPEHLSLYSLIVEPNTPLYHRVETGKTPAPDEDAAAEMYEAALVRLENAGYVQYEVSNWARPGQAARQTAHASALTPEYACQHNLIYWRNQEYLGVGPGAHSHLRMVKQDAPDAEGAKVRTSRRWGNRKPAAGYIKRIQRGDSAEEIAEFSEELDAATSMSETMMLGLRLLREGVSYQRFLDLHGVDLREVYARQVAQLVDWGLLDAGDERVRLTHRGLMVGNQVFAAFVGSPAGDATFVSNYADTATFVSNYADTATFVGNYADSAMRVSNYA